MPRHLRNVEVVAASDGRCIRLPRELANATGSGSANTQYRLLAIEQAERIARGTATMLPAIGELLERDLYLLSEAAAVDAEISRSMSALIPAISIARAQALQNRIQLSKLAAHERGVELILRSVLASDPAMDITSVPRANTPADSLAWARATAATLRGESRSRRDRYRGLAPVAFWGTVNEPERIPERPRMNPAEQQQEDDEKDESSPDATMRDPQHRECKRPPIPAAPGSSQLLAQVESTQGEDKETVPLTDSNQKPDGYEDDADEGVASDAPSTANPGTSATESPSPTRDETGEHHPLSAGIDYPEWDCYAGNYRTPGSTVHVSRHIGTDSPWAAEVLRERAVLVRRVRERFERLRSQRVKLTRQRDGDELDLAACVRALVDLRMARTPDDRLYMSVRPARRALAIALLVDVSGSTDAQVSDSLQVIDVERIALLLASEAFDALGDLYSILTFSSMGAADVRVSLIKDFTERNGDAVRQRISAMTSGGNTRLGAAVRHATALLAAQPAGHRLLLILSDGKPSDTDRYYEKYAVEDSRQAIAEARSQGVYPFCITVDASDAQEYLSHIFGPAGHTTLRQPEQLPLALLRVVRLLLGAQAS
ncbi:MAG: nitric oxide reductase activation protein NorD [Gemmatimonadaceae bacterium]